MPCRVVANGWCFRDIYIDCILENDLYVSALLLRIQVVEM